MPERGPAATREEWIDPPLSARGARQAEAVGVGLEAEPIDVVYASPLKRAADTARAIAERHGLEVHTLAELREIELFRDLPDGKSVTDLLDALLLSGVRERFARERRWDVYPYGETGDELRHRVAMAVEGIIATHAGSTIVVACHGGVINSYLGVVFGDHCRGHVVPAESRFGPSVGRARRSTSGAEPERGPPLAVRRPGARVVVSESSAMWKTNRSQTGAGPSMR